MVLALEWFLYFSLRLLYISKRVSNLLHAVARAHKGHRRAATNDNSKLALTGWRFATFTWNCTAGHAFSLNTAHQSQLCTLQVLDSVKQYQVNERVEAFQDTGYCRGTQGAIRTKGLRTTWLPFHWSTHLHGRR